MQVKFLISIIYNATLSLCSYMSYMVYSET